MHRALACVLAVALWSGCGGDVGGDPARRDAGVVTPRSDAGPSPAGDGSMPGIDRDARPPGSGDGGTTLADGGPPIALPCDDTLGPGDDVAAAAESAPIGTVLCLEAGDYGEVAFEGISRSGEVIVRSASGRGASIGIVIRSSTHLRFQSLTIEWLDLGGSGTEHIRVEASTFTGQAVLRMERDGGGDVSIDGSTFDGIDVCDDCYEGRLEVIGDARPSGVTITNCHFGGPGESDGIQIGAYGVVVGPGNVFDGIVQGDYGRHVDAIQLYGQSHTVITGNYFVNNDVQIMSPDGGESETVTHNVFVGGDYGPSIQMGSVSDLTFSHNTVIRVGVQIDKKTERPDASANAIVRDNVMIDSHFDTTDSDGTPACTECTFDHNLFADEGDARGTATVIGAPTFVGGAEPSSWSGFRLAEGSLGRGAASDGTDMGSNLLP